MAFPEVPRKSKYKVGQVVFVISDGVYARVKNVLHVRPIAKYMVRPDGKCLYELEGEIGISHYACDLRELTDEEKGRH